MVKYVKFNRVETEYTVLEFRGGDESVKVNYFSTPVVSIIGDDEAKINALIGSQSPEINCMEITQDEFKELIKCSIQYKRIKERVAEFFEKQLQQLIVEYPLGERETWNRQLEQAKAYKASGDEADAPFLKVLADAESDTVENFANAVIAKAEAYEVFVAEKLTEKRAYERQLMAEIGL